jgi:hypothetical protein
MKTVLLICILVLLVSLNIQIASAKNVDSNLTQNNNASPLLLRSQFEAEGDSSSMSREASNESRVDSDFSYTFFPYLFYALSIIGLLAVLSFDTSGSARSKRKHKKSHR